MLAPVVLAIVAGLLLAPASAIVAQQPSAEARLRAQEDSLDRLRRERADLQQRMDALEGTAHTITEELTNLSAQVTTTRQLVRGLDQQLEFASAQVETVTDSLVYTEDRLAATRAILQRRLIDIYKRGPLNTLEVMLSARSFGDLIARYRWLHLLAQRDKALLRSVTELHAQIAARRQSRVQFQQQVEQTRAERADEEARLRDLAAQQTRQLRTVEGQAGAARTRLAAIARDEARMNSLISALVAERARAGATAPAVPGATAAALRVGANLDWPVTSRTLLFPFGPVTGPNGTTTRRNGIGIGAPAGTPVRAVAAAQVAIIETNFATYGTVVFLNHPAAGYSVYGSLGRVDVKVGDFVNRGQVIGTVGVSDPTLGPYLYFEIRGLSGSQTLDPLTILRPR